MYMCMVTVYMLQIFIRNLVVVGLVLDGTFIHGSHYSPQQMKTMDSTGSVITQCTHGMAM